ncbi:MAG TPA: heme ABC exporter ATP-binding protein CcmA [Thermomicrobiaceae bacterium]|nr:heme ABC exporter ATP-binding protein CcmA [Thermomicrobiaceae bacterium]
MNELQSIPVIQQAPAAPVRAPAPRLEAQHVSKRFDNRMVLRPLDLTLLPGERAVLFGANGAGKTTLLRILATLSRPTTGRMLIENVSVERDARRARRALGVVAHQPYLYDDLTAEENLRFFARMYDVAAAERRIDDVLGLVGLRARRADRVHTFSRGMQQRLAMGRAILHQPAVLLLDEPDTGLDREGMRLLQRLIGEQAAAGGSVLLTTHDLRFGLACADRVLLLEQGRVTLDAPAGDVDEGLLDQRLAAPA